LFGRDVRVVRGWGILVLGYEGVGRIGIGFRDHSVLLAGLKIIAYY
jgi:hypothetical protein